MLEHIITLWWFKLCVLALLKVSWCSSLLYKYSFPKFLLCFSYSPCFDNSYHMEQNISTLYLFRKIEALSLFFLWWRSKYTKVTIIQKWYYIKEKCVPHPPQKKKKRIKTCQVLTTYNLILLMLLELLKSLDCKLNDGMGSFVQWDGPSI